MKNLSSQMKKMIYIYISFNLLFVFAAVDIQAQTFIFPVYPELELPATSDFAVQDKILNTSSYAYEGVKFNTAALDEEPFFEKMDLFVYSWQALDDDGSGIAFERISTTTGILANKGFVSTDPNKKYTEVGIVQNANDSVFVIALWNGEHLDKIGTFYDVYHWTNTSLDLISEGNAINFSNPLDASSMGFRVSMDCLSLKKVIFCWEEWPSGHPLNEGGIFLKALESAGSPPFLVTEIYKLDTITAGTLYPDVAFADQGKKVRIAFRTQELTTPISYTLNIVNIPYTTITSSGFYPPSSTLSTINVIPYDIDYKGISLIKENPFPFVSFTNVNDQISLDCPDDFPYDIWTAVVASDYDIMTVIKPHPSVPEVVLKLTEDSLPGKNVHPVVAYQNFSFMQGITYMWYNFGYDSYISTALTLSGSYFYPPFGSYFKVNNATISNVVRDAMRPSLSRNNTVNRGVYCAYPFNAATPANFDMRSKIVPVAISSFKSETDKLKIDEYPIIQASPNPFKDHIELTISHYAHQKLAWQILNIQGKIVGSGSDVLLNDLNVSLNSILNRLSTGEYMLHIQYEKENHNIKLIKY